MARAERRRNAYELAVSRKQRRWGRWISEEDHFGEGGQARVYSVVDSQHEYDGRYVLKELKNPKRIDRFLREVDVLKQLASSANIIPIIDSGIHRDGDSSKSCYVMPHAESDLNELVVAQNFDLDGALNVFEQICRGAADLHSIGIVHRDLKPDNILILNGVAMVSDMGLAFELEAERFTRTREVVGARYFTAPELEEGRLEEIGRASCRERV